MRTTVDSRRVYRRDTTTAPVGATDMGRYSVALRDE
jgi:hypothetical protein